MKKLYLLVILGLVGCSNLPKETYIPVVSKCPAPEIPTEPHLPIVDLKPNDKPNKVIKVYAASVLVQKNYIKQLKTILKGYT